MKLDWVMDGVILMEARSFINQQALIVYIAAGFDKILIMFK